MSIPSIPGGLIIAAALGQVFTAFAYPFIRRLVLDWYSDLAKLTALNKEIAKTYGHYIMGMNLAFGIISLLFSGEIQNRSGLAVAFSGLIAVYWLIRVYTQFAVYPMHTLVKTKWIKAGEIALDALIIFFAIVYSWLFLYNLYGYL